MGNAKKPGLIPLLLGLALLATACGGSAAPAGQVSSAGLETPAMPTGAVETDAPAAETPSSGKIGDAGKASAQEAAAEPSEPESAADTETHISAGRIRGGTYTNEYAGFACDLDSTWEYYTADELAENAGLPVEIFEGTSLENAMDGVEQFVDMKAESVESLSTINVLFQKLSMQERVAYVAMSEDDILDLMLNTMSDELKSAYSNAGMNISGMEKAEVIFLGEKRAALRTAGDIQGLDVYIVQVFDYHLGEYSCTVTFFSYVEDHTDNLLAMFYKI